MFRSKKDFNTISILIIRQKNIKKEAITLK